MQGERIVSPGGTIRAPNFASRRRGERSGTAQSDLEETPVVECLLEEITDRPIEIETISTVKVRDDDRPPSPIFVPQPRGVDIATQVEDGDLFDFDVEVEPILQTLVGNTLEKSLAEVIEELDLEEELQSREVFELVRVSERLECERVQLSDSRKQAERQRREVQNVKREEETTVSTKKSAASTFAHTYVGDVVSDVFENLDGAGFFFDPLIPCARPALVAQHPMLCPVCLASRTRPTFVSLFWPALRVNSVSIVLAVSRRCSTHTSSIWVCREIEEVFLPWLEEGVHANISMAHDNEKAVQEVVAGTVALQETKRHNAAAEYEAMQTAIKKAEDDRVAEEARLVEEMEAAAAVAAEEARLAAEAEAAAQAAAADQAEAEGQAAAE